MRQPEKAAPSLLHSVLWEAHQSTTFLNFFQFICVLYLIPRSTYLIPQTSFPIMCTFYSNSIHAMQTVFICSISVTRRYIYKWAMCERSWDKTVNQPSMQTLISRSILAIALSGKYINDGHSSWTILLTIYHLTSVWRMDEQNSSITSIRCISQPKSQSTNNICSFISFCSGWL